MTDSETAQAWELMLRVMAVALVTDRGNGGDTADGCRIAAQRRDELCSRSLPEFTVR
jgi:hypothetical protein